jgi:uncharacterized membrane protein
MGKSHRKLKGLLRESQGTFLKELNGDAYYTSNRNIRREVERESKKVVEQPELQPEVHIHEEPIVPDTRIDSWDILFKLGIVILIYQIINFFILWI